MKDYFSMDKLFYISICFLVLAASCTSPDEGEEAFVDEQRKVEKKDTVAQSEHDNEIVAQMYRTGQYWRKDEYGTYKLLISEMGPDKCKFVFDWRGPCYTKIAGEVSIDKKGKGTYKAPGCEALDFSFFKDRQEVSVKEFKCNFHGSQCSFDGLYKIKDFDAYDKVDAVTILDDLEKGKQKFDFYANFTEPFFTIYMFEDIIVMNRADQEKPDLFEANCFFNINGKSQKIIFNYGEEEHTLLIRKEDGSDGMSPIIYPYSVTLDGNFVGGGGRKFQKEPVMEE